MTKKNIYDKINIIAGMILLILVLAFAIYNIPVLYSLGKSNLVNLSRENLQGQLAAIDVQLKQSVKCKNEFTDIYGFAQKVLNKFIIGNFEYLYENEHMHRIQEYGYGEDAFLEEVQILNQQMTQAEIPFLYVQGPNREAMVGGEKALEFNPDQQCMNKMVNTLTNNGVDVIDTREIFYDADYDLSKVFLHTDLHMQTDAEIFVAGKLAEYLANKTGIQSEQQYLLEDMSYYEKKTYPFFGNYSRNVGKFYLKEDMFDMYYPTFDTNFTRIDHVTGAEVHGSFQEVVMNRYENQDVIDEYTYWVTNYMQFMNPYYTIINHNNEEGAKYLFIMDSIGYRTVSYLALTASEITILDPRFFNGTDYLSIALSDRDYDAVVLYQGTFLLGNHLYQKEEGQ